jgi:ATP-binding cassette subfamily B protein
MKKIFQQLTKKEIILILICMFLICFQVRLDLELPEYMWNIAELVKTEWTHISEIIKQWKMMLIITLWSVWISIFLVLFPSKIAANFSARLRLKIYETVQNFSMENVKDFSIASLITRETNDVVQVQSAIVQWIQIFTKAPILAGWAIIKILDKNPVRSTATALAIGIVIIMAILTLILVIPKSRII